MAVEIGESLVGSYLRYVVGCEVIVYNTFMPNIQGEIDVIGLQHGNPRIVWLCEVVTHIRGVLYGGSAGATAAKIRDKIGRARDFATVTFPGDIHRYEIWSPIVPSGTVTQFSQIAEAFSSEELDVRFVVNEEYTSRVQAVVDHARSSSKATGEPAYRLLQILTRLRGGISLRPSR